MGALTAKETLIPATARLDVAHANERLWTHTPASYGVAWKSQTVKAVKKAAMNFAI